MSDNSLSLAFDVKDIRCVGNRAFFAVFDGVPLYTNPLLDTVEVYGGKDTVLNCIAYNIKPLYIWNTTPDKKYLELVQSATNYMDTVRKEPSVIRGARYSFIYKKQIEEIIKDNTFDDKTVESFNCIPDNYVYPIITVDTPIADHWYKCAKYIANNFKEFIDIMPNTVCPNRPFGDEILIMSFTPIERPVGAKNSGLGMFLSKLQDMYSNMFKAVNNFIHDMPKGIARLDLRVEEIVKAINPNHCVEHLYDMSKGLDRSRNSNSINLNSGILSPRDIISSLRHDIASI